MRAKTFALVIVLAWVVMLAKSLEFEPPYFRPWEALRVGTVAFAPNRTWNREEFGGLAYRSWVRELQRPHLTTFTTDRFGFRNLEEHRTPPRVVMVGDSFVAGLGVSDDETTPVQLSKRLGTTVYNYGGESYETIRYLLADPRFAEAPPALVIFAVVDPASPVPLPERVDPSAEAETARQLASPPAWAPLLAAWRSVGEALNAIHLVLERDNGFTRFAKFTFHETQYRLFGLPGVVQIEGEPALVQTLEQQKLFESLEQRKLDATVDSYVAFRDAFAERGTRFVVVPLPDTGTLYRDAFPPEDQAKVAKPEFRPAFIERLKARGLEVIDPAPFLFEHRSPYLYLRDDTHFTPRGHALTAQVIAEALLAGAREQR